MISRKPFAELTDVGHRDPEGVTDVDAKSGHPVAVGFATERAQFFDYVVAVHWSVTGRASDEFASG